MTIRQPRCGNRRGITLFEVVIALVIFTLTLPALITLVQLGTLRANKAAFLSIASQECRSKLDEVMVGAEPLESVDWTPLTEPNWFWKLQAVDGSIDNITEAQVSVKLDIPGSSGPEVLVTISQWIIDPSMRGSTQDRGLIDAALGTTSSSSSSSTGTGTSTGTTGTGTTGTGGTTP
jgi:Tfp pilus assembly protein PilV